MSTSIALSPAISSVVHPPTSHACVSTSVTATTGPKALKSCIVALPLSLFASQSRIKKTSYKRTSRTITRCEVAVKSADSVNTDSSCASETEIEAEEKAKVGSRVRVTAPLKVYHVNRVPEVDLEGMEGKLKDYVVVWKGKRISANLPYKVEFFKEIEGRGPVKFVAHLMEDEFEFLD